MAVNLRAVLSDKCNYRCVFCSRDFNSAVNLDMQPEFLETCIEVFSSLGGTKITYTGGEPLIYPELMRIMKFADSLGLMNFVTTNAAMLNIQPEEFYSLAGALNISIPSFDPEEYTSLTGGKSLESVKHNAVYAAGLGLKVKINCVYTEGRELMIEEMIDYFAPHGIIVKIMNDMLAGKEYYSAFMKYVSRFRNDRRAEIESALNPGYAFCEDCNITRKSSCPSCRSLWVYPDGKITLCPFDGAKSYLHSCRAEIYTHVKELMNYDG